MILCSCKSISSKQVNRLVQEQQLDPDAALRQLGGGSICGRCSCGKGTGCHKSVGTKVDPTSG
ncbi:MAG: hypothetical protein RRB13_11565 [bacterium]|nr:hypothetical protein [bacterium]